MTIDVEALQFLTRLGAEAAGTVTQISQDGERIMVIKDGVIHQEHTLPQIPTFTLGSLPSVVQFARDNDVPADVAYEATDEDNVCRTDTAIFVKDDEIVVYPSVFDTRSKATMALRLTKVYKTLDGLTEARSFTAKQARMFLRTKLGVTPHDAILNKLSAVQCHSVGENRQHARHGTDSLGTSVDREVVNAADIPESFPITVFPYINAPQFSYSVPVGIELNPADPNPITLFVVHDDLDHMLRRCQQELVEHLAEELKAQKIPVYAG